LAGATLKSGVNNLTLANNIVVTATSTLDMVANNTTLNGSISGSGALNLTNSGLPSTLTLVGDNSSYTGTITLNNGNAISFNSPNAGSAGAAWVFNDAAGDRVRINTGTGTISFGSMAGAGQIQNDAVGTNVTVSTGALNTSTTFSGTMKDNVGLLSLAKTGTGTLTLTGGNVYAGTTAITNGTLLVNGTHTTAGAYAVSGGALGGTGAIATSSNAGVTVLAGGKLAPGGAAAAGKLTLNLGNGSLDISSAEAASNSQSLLFRIGSTANSDKIQITGGFNIGTGTLEFNDFVFSDVGGIQANTTYTLVDATSITGTLGSVMTGTFGIGNSVTGTLALDQANGDLLLNVTSAPEPGMAVPLLGLGAWGFMSRRRRRA
jgi:autotransporter-associated beta strand protein